LRLLPEHFNEWVGGQKTIEQWTVAQETSNQSTPMHLFSRIIMHRKAFPLELDYKASHDDG